jgi:hypothetical protein
LWPVQRAGEFTIVEKIDAFVISKKRLAGVKRVSMSGKPGDKLFSEAMAWRSPLQESISIKYETQRR